MRGSWCWLGFGAWRWPGWRAWGETAPPGWRTLQCCKNYPNYCGLENVSSCVWILQEERKTYLIKTSLFIFLFFFFKSILLEKTFKGALCSLHPLGSRGVMPVSVLPWHIPACPGVFLGAGAACVQGCAVPPIPWRLLYPIWYSMM